METQTFYWVVSIGVGLVFLQLVAITERVKDINHKVEWWGKYFAEEIEKIRAQGEERGFEVSEIKDQVQRISDRTQEHLPSEEERKREIEQRDYGL